MSASLDNYFKIQFECIPEIQEILIAELSLIGYETFEQEESNLIAYIKTNDYEEGLLFEALEKYSIETGSIIKTEYDGKKNWNETWEKDFQPIEIGRSLRIRAPFHDSDPSFDHELLIHPKMAFGTGHHETTHLCLERLISMEIESKSILDMGCGTGILGILAEKRGADQVLGIDIDDFSVENSLENLELNNCNKTRIKKGDIEALKAENQTFDIIIANINLNVLLADIPVYLNYLRVNGFLLLSGFLISDIPKMEKLAEEHKLYLDYKEVMNKWACISYKKA